MYHVGFLGAAAPAVEGLKEIQFNAEDDLLSFSDEFIPDDEDEYIDEQKNTSLKIKLDPAPDLKNFQASIESLNTIVSELKNNFSKLSDDELSKIHSRINELSFAMQVNDFELRLNEKLAYGSLTPAMKNKIMDIVSFLQKQNFSNSDFSFEQYIAQIKNLLLEFTESIPKINLLRELCR